MPELARTPVRMCVGCKATTTSPILVRHIEQQSGPGCSIYACPACAPDYMSPNEAFSALFDHTLGCEQCSLPSPAEPCPTGHTLVRVHTAALRRIA
ncbi:hypothetical protein [Kitasatospora sp. NPDC051914]|uniref:hypothetical protein n=1 Tax=Kitasatospora sp. NPDC051914 TaxID=3154945 RepID=UPI0034296CC4